MTPLHVGILLAFAACLFWSISVLVHVVADLVAQGRAAHHRRASWHSSQSGMNLNLAGTSSSARRSDADPAAAQDQPRGGADMSGHTWT